jgi:hypothetical protein
MLGFSPAVFGLFAQRKPDTVAGFVMSIYFEAFNRILAGRSWSHIGKEVGEGVPALAYRDAAATVILETSGLWISASFKHCIPRIIGSGFLSVAGAAMDAHSISLSTSTGRCEIRSQLVTTDYFYGSAVATAAPHDRGIWASAHWLDNNEAVETLASDVFEIQ